MQHMTNLPDVGRELAKLRKSRGMTQRELATACGMGQSTLARFETGGVPEFGARKLMRLLEVLGFGLSYVPLNKNFTLDDALEQRLRNSNP